MKVTKGTIIRTILVVLVIVNIILERCGIKPINVDNSTIGMIVETVVEVASIAAAWWYNNSLTENAKKADEFLQKLNDSEDTEKS